MRVTFDLPPEVWWRVQDIAEEQGCSAADVMVSAIGMRLYTYSGHKSIREMVMIGMCDADIAAAIGYTPGSVAARRRRMGLPANRRYRAEKGAVNG